MSNNFLKEIIVRDIKAFALEESDPYKWWQPDLFSSIDPNILRDGIDIQRYRIALGTQVIVDRVKVISKEFTPPTQWIIEQSVCLALFYASFVYPRENVFPKLSALLPDGSMEKTLCRKLHEKQFEHRHIRNAIAHGDIEFGMDDSVIVRDIKAKWEQTYKLRKLVLDALIIADIFLSAFARTRFASPEYPIG